MCPAPATAVPDDDPDASDGSYALQCGRCGAFVESGQDGVCRCACGSRFCLV